MDDPIVSRLNELKAEQERLERELREKRALQDTPEQAPETDAEKRQRLGYAPGPSPFGKGNGGGMVHYPKAGETYGR